MEDNRIYRQPKGTVIDAINDIVELQKGKLTFSDTSKGKIHFKVKMYANKWDLRFAVTDIGTNQCSVHINVGLETPEHEKMIKREFALLDSILIV